MSDELRLPDRLAACEAELAAQPLPASTISRDELLYRAGWAAAEAALARQAASTERGEGAPRKAIALWSIASAAAAAVVVAAVTWSAVAPTSRSAIATPTGERPSLTSATAEAPPRPLRRAPIDVPLAELDALVGGPTTARRDAPTSSLWLASRRSRFDAWDQQWLVMTGVAASTPPGVESVTARQLLEEYLPGREASGAGGAKSSPGVLDFLRPWAWGGDAI